MGAVSAIHKKQSRFGICFIERCSVKAILLLKVFTSVKFKFIFKISSDSYCLDKVPERTKSFGVLFYHFCYFSYDELSTDYGIGLADKKNLK